ncbi:voltage-gated potassium channel [Hoeflea marina]|uniref:Voltage-gated potassium channel n=1 Tax=Hoeflea marina TaxID=274592 RepID=A0A317PEW1_9HYPH|nr:ion channel [Hoeflea marina]PWV97492.1 voltage-gated potassium channel [Hoeflea marina]
MISREQLRETLRRLYAGEGRSALRYQAVLATIDLAIIAFFIFGPYLRAGASYLIIDYLIAVWIAGELVVQAAIARRPRDWLLRPMTWVDLVILGTLLFPNLLYNFAFLRAMRIWVIGQSPLLKVGLRRIGQSELQDVIRALINVLVFLFMTTGFVYTFFFYRQDGTAGFVDALYYTVATVTTTGFGDIILPGTFGKLTSIVTMIVGISLFVRLAQAVVRPYKVTFPCPNCGLFRHDADAVHCKACGNILNIPDDGA